MYGDCLSISFTFRIRCNPAPWLSAGVTGVQDYITSKGGEGLAGGLAISVPSIALHMPISFTGMGTGMGTFTGMGTAGEYGACTVPS